MEIPYANSWVNCLYGFASFRTAWRALRGYEIMNMIRKGQLQGAAKGDVLAQNHLMAEVFGIGV